MTEQPAQPALPVPTAAWVLAWSCLAGQVLVLGERGAQSSTTGMLVSALIGAVVVAWVSKGVLTARPGRLILVWVMFVLSAILYGAALLDTSVAGALGGVIGTPEDAPMRFQINV